MTHNCKALSFLHMYHKWELLAIEYVKGIGGSTLIFTSWFYFIKFYLSYQTFLTAWKNWSLISRIFFLNFLVTSIGSLWKAQTKNAKKDHFTKNLSPPSFFYQSSSNFHRKCIIKKKQPIFLVFFILNFIF